MRICEIIGSVTLARAPPGIQGAVLRLAIPMSLADLRAGHAGNAEELIVVDELGAGLGSRVGVSEGREAAMPFHPERKPVDAYCACLLDQVVLGKS